MIDLWKMAGDIAKLQTYKLYDDGAKLVELEDVLAIIRKYILEEKGNNKNEQK